jgi:hypothetical protein
VTADPLVEWDFGSVEHLNNSGLLALSRVSSEILRGIWQLPEQLQSFRRASSIAIAALLTVWEPVSISSNAARLPSRISSLRLLAHRACGWR